MDSLIKMVKKHNIESGFINCIGALKKFTIGFYEIDSNLVLNYALGLFLLIFALGALSLLCASIFLESNKSLSAAGALIIGQYFLESLGGILATLGSIQFFSLFHYFKIGNILTEGMLPILDVVIVLTIGIVALVSALVIFDKREFAL